MKINNKSIQDKKQDFINSYLTEKIRLTTIEYSIKYNVSEGTIKNWINETTLIKYKQKLYKSIVKQNTFKNEIELARLFNVDRRTIVIWRKKFFKNLASPEKQRQKDFIKLYECKKFSIDEIARFLKVTPTSVRRYLHKLKNITPYEYNCLLPR